MVLNPPNLIWTMGCKFDPYTGERRMYGFFEPDSEEYNHVWDVDWLTGMGTVLSKEILTQVGWLNEKIFRIITATATTVIGLNWQVSG